MVSIFKLAPLPVSCRSTTPFYYINNVEAFFLFPRHCSFWPRHYSRFPQRRRFLSRLCSSLPQHCSLLLFVRRLQLFATTLTLFATKLQLFARKRKLFAFCHYIAAFCHNSTMQLFATTQQRVYVCIRACVFVRACMRVCVKLQALVYDILPSTTAVFSYAIRSRKLTANEQFFVGAQTVVYLLQTTQIKQAVSFTAVNKVYTSTNKTIIV